MVCWWWTTHPRSRWSFPSTCAPLSWILTKEQVPATVTAAIQSVSDNPIVILLLINLMLLVLGAFMEMIAALIILVPILLLAGLRYRGPLNAPVLLGTGAASGFLGGVVGVPGPPVILLYLASTRLAAQVRANILIYLFAFDIVLIALLAIQNRLEAVPVILGLILALPVMLANMAGAAIFRPEKERIYRAAAYVIIAAAAISGLPLWD